MQSNMLIANLQRLASESQTRVVDGEAFEEHYQRVAPAAIGAQPRVLARYLRQLGAVPDPTDMAVDGSATPVAFLLTPAAAEVYRIDRLTLIMVTVESPVMTEFGDVAAPTGMLLEHLAAGIPLIDLFDGVPARSLIGLPGWATTLYEQPDGFAAVATWSPRSPIRLIGGLNHALRATVRDNLSELVVLRVLVEGAIETVMA